MNKHKHVKHPKRSSRYDVLGKSCRLVQLKQVLKNNLFDCKLSAVFTLKLSLNYSSKHLNRGLKHERYSKLIHITAVGTKMQPAGQLQPANAYRPAAELC